MVAIAGPLRKNTIILFKVQVWVVLDVSLIFPVSFVFSTNCMCYASTAWQFAYGAHLYSNTQCYVLAFLHVLWIPLCHSNKGDKNNYTPVRLNLYIYLFGKLPRHNRRVWSSHCLYFCETQSSQNTHGETKRAWNAAKVYQKGTIRYLPYSNSAQNLVISCDIRSVTWLHATGYTKTWVY